MKLMAKLYAQRKDGFDINKMTVVGSPTITSDGVASNLSQTGYFAVPFIDFKNKSFSYKARVKFDDLSGDRSVIFGQYSSNTVDYKLPSLVCEWTKLRLYTPKNGTAWDIYAITDFEMQVNTWYDIELVIDLTNVILKVNDKIILTKACSGITYDIGTNTVCLGTTLNLTSWKLDGSIDLTAFKIYVDGELVYSPTKPAYALERRKEGFDLSKFTVVGSPTITEDGVASGFSTDNTKYVQFDSSCLKNSTDYAITFSFISSAITAQKTLINNFVPLSDLNCAIITHASKFLMFLGDGTVRYNIANSITGKVVLQSNVKYYVKISFNGSKYTLYYSTDNKNWVEDISVTSSLIANWTNILCLGNKGYWPVPINESFDLKDISITVDGKEVFTGAKEKFYAMRKPQWT